MHSDLSSGGRGAGRPRSTKVREAILATTLRLVKEQGFAALTIEGIAREAGVGKPTIYRWWPSKAAIVFEVLQQYAYQTLPLPDEAPLRERLECWLKQLFAVLNGDVGEIVRGLMAEAQLDPIFADFFRTEFILLRRQPIQTILREGLQHGELPASTSIEVMTDLIYGAMWYRLLTQHAPLDDDFAHDIICTMLL